MYIYIYYTHYIHIYIYICTHTPTCIGRFCAPPDFVRRRRRFRAAFLEYSSFIAYMYRKFIIIFLILLHIFIEYLSFPPDFVRRRRRFRFVSELLLCSSSKINTISQYIVIKYIHEYFVRVVK